MTKDKTPAEGYGPTDAELEALARQHGTGGWQTLSDMVRFARVVLASQPQPKGTQGDYLDGVNIARLRECLNFLGCASDGMEAMAASLPEFINRLTLAVERSRTMLSVQTQSPAPAPGAAVTMADAVAAGDGTLHGAIDYWQERALKAEAQCAAVAPEPIPKGWTLNHAQQQTDEDGPVDGVWEIGFLDPEDDRFSPIVTVDTGLYYQDKQAEPLARAILARLTDSHVPVQSKE